MRSRTSRDKFEEVRRHWRSYVFQSLLATVAIFVVLLVLSLQQAVVVASIGASAFIVFAMPKSVTAQPRNVIGGHLVGMMSGALFSSLTHPLALKSMIMFPLAVGLSVFVMVVTDTEHPPASGTALGVAMTGLSVGVAVAIATSAVILSLIHRLLGPRLRDLT
jgi:CBS-domain-containing membrane protein